MKKDDEFNIIELDDFSTQEIPIVLSEATMQNIPDNPTPKSSTRKVPKKTSKEISNDNSKKISKDITNNVSRDVSKKGSVAKKVPREVSKEVPKEVPKEVLQERVKSKKSKHNKKNQPLTASKVIARIFIVIGSTLGMALIFVLLVLFALIKGPSSEAKKLFTLSAYETSAIKWVPRIFESKAEYDSIIHPKPVSDSFVQLPIASKSLLAESNEEMVTLSEEELKSIEIIDIKGATYHGKLMLVHDPSRVSFVSLDSFGGTGLTLSSFIEKYNGIGGANAGGFEDEGGKGKGGIPDGIVIRDGKIIYGSAGSRYKGFAGFDSEHVLHVGDLTGQEALDLNVDNGTNFANGPVLIKDGVRQNDLVSGINPRTAIGQTIDGTVAILVLEGRLANSLGATFEDMCDVFEKYNVINAVNMDGGSSSGLYYEGERITKSCSLIGDRPIPTAIVVSK